MLTRLAIRLLLAAALLGCERQPSGPRSNDVAAGPRRIVCLSPAMTQMVLDLGLADAIVGVSLNDDSAPPGVRVVGTYTDVDYEALYAVEPTHVLMQTGKAGPPARLLQLAEDGRFVLAAFEYPTTIRDVADQLHRDDGGLSLGAVLDAPEAAAALRSTMMRRLEALQQAVADQPRRRVLLIIDTNPLMASGGGTVLDEMLAVAGGRNAAPANATAPTLDREKLLGINPDVILLLMPGQPPLGPADADERWRALRGSPLAAVEAGRVHLINDPQVLLPSTTIPRVVGAMAKLLHPERAAAIEAAMEAEP